MAPHSGRITLGVQRLLLLSAAVFAVQLVVHMFEPLVTRTVAPLGEPGLEILRWFAFDPLRFPWSGFIWQPLTYMFLHAGLLHLFTNLLWLFAFGPDVGSIIGTWTGLDCGESALSPTGITPPPSRTSSSWCSR